jgi:hypothetical protein
VSDEFETLLRDHFRRAAEGIHPEPEMIERARAARRGHARAWWPRMSAVAVGVTGLATAAGLVAVFAVLSGSPDVRRPGPAARPTEEITIHARRTAVPVGGEIRLSGAAPGRLDVFLRMSGSWRDVGDATPTDGRYATAVIAWERTSAVRVCLAGSSVCSVTLRLSVVSTPTPRSIPTGVGPSHPITASTVPPTATPTGQPTPLRPVPTPQATRTS